MSVFVVDASVAGKWFLPAKSEPLTEDALHLFRRYADGEVRLVVPDLFWAELGNLLWKAVRQRRITIATAEASLDSLRECALPTVSSLPLLEVAFRLATTFDRTVYDCLYVAMALHSKGQLITADERLANALAAHLPVKWLGGM